MRCGQQRCLSEGLACQGQAFPWASLPLVTSRAVTTGLARKLTVAAQGTAAAPLCTNGKENAHGGRWATQATGSLWC